MKKILLILFSFIIMYQGAPGNTSYYGPSGNKEDAYKFSTIGEAYNYQKSYGGSIVVLEE